MIIDRILSINQQVSDNYYKTILENNISSIKIFEDSDDKELLSKTPSVNFFKDSLSFFSSIKSEKITLYDRNGRKFLSSNDKIIVSNTNNNFSLNSILYELDNNLHIIFNLFNHTDNIEDAIYKGKNSYELIKFLSITDRSTQTLNQSVVKAYFPIFNYKNFGVVGVIEIITNITDDIITIDRVILISLISFLISFFLFFIIIIIIINNVQKFINQHIKMTRDLEDARKIAETESSAKTEFLANISHELRSPLNSIIGFSEIILNSGIGFAAIKENKYFDYINDINLSGRHLLAIINDILDFSKASSYQLNVEAIEFDLNKVCQSSMRFIKPRADEAGINLIEILPEKNLVIKADPKRLKQALLNLLSNSVKFTQKGGSISVELKIDNDLNKAIIIVRDTGIGISQKDIPKALSLFHQIDNKLNRKYEGTGLGLPLTKKLVELMGGEFDISSIENSGTIVTMLFPYKIE
jgi:two-component system cell cycle sensor histidine kinase PleC